jgi:hypothetical protein
VFLIENCPVGSLDSLLLRLERPLFCTNARIRHAARVPPWSFVASPCDATFVKIVLPKVGGYAAQ